MERDMSSLDPIERNTLRLAAYEMLFTETDVPIIISKMLILNSESRIQFLLNFFSINNLLKF